MELSRKGIAQLIGRVFLQKAAVNLLSTVLDTPEFFWSAPDSMQTLYKKVCEYMELEERVDVLNNRFQVRCAPLCPSGVSASLPARYDCLQDPALKGTRCWPCMT